MQKTITYKEVQETAERLTGSRLTMKQANFTKAVLETANPTEAAIEAYNIGEKHNKGKALSEQDKEHAAYQIAYENMRKPKVKETIDALMERVGLTRELVTSSLAEDIALFKGKRRTNELALAGKWLQLEKPATTNILNLGLSDEQAERLLEL